MISHQDFIDKFFRDDDYVAITRIKYLLRLHIMSEKVRDYFGTDLSSTWTWILSKIQESEEQLTIITGTPIYVSGTVLSHRIFFEWLLDEAMKLEK